MRIGILGSRGYPSTYGGFETFVRHLAPYLADHGHQVSVYCRREKSDIRWRSSFHGKVRQIQTPGLSGKSVSTLSYGLTAALDSWWRRFDAVLVLNVANGFFLPIINRRGTNVVVNVDGLEWKRDKWGRIGKGVFLLGAKATARFADEIITDSQAISEAWRDLLGRAGSFIPYGADVITDRPINRVQELGLRPREYCLVVGRLVPENNVDLILDGYKRASIDWPIVVVGSSNYENATTRRLRREADGKWLHWLGHVNDQDLLTDLWAHCGLYVHGHSVGGTNPALLQALGAGSPTLAYRTPFNAEVLASDRPLFSNIPELTAKINQLAGDPDYQIRLAETGRMRVAQSYTWPLVCESYLRCLERPVLEPATGNDQALESSPSTLGNAR